MAPPPAAFEPADVELTAGDLLTVRRHLLLGIALSLLAILGAVLAGILYLCNGHLLYSFDDAYISLSLGWHLAHGTYGINPGEAASPSSSILYPLLLAAVAWSRWQNWAPLAINGLAAIGAGLLFGEALCRYGIIRARSEVASGVLLVVLICLASFALFVVFVGLEHSLHLLTSVFVVFTMARTLEEGAPPVPPLLAAAIVLLPLWRFEGIALAGLAVAVLALAGHRRWAIVTLFGIAATLGAYLAAMHLLGLPLLPSSVLTKSALARQALGAVDRPSGVLASAFANVAKQFSGDRLTTILLVGPLLLPIGLVVAHPLLRVLRPSATQAPAWAMREECLFVALTAGAMLAQFVFGLRSDRYDAYACGIGIAASLVLWRDYARKLVDGGNWILACAGLVPLAYFVFATAVETPLAARGHYEQQYQMGRFAAAFYRGPVAVNDLGLVSYRNPYYVLDLAGLGSEAAREAHLNVASDPYWMNRLVEQHQVGVAMLFDKWFRGQIPPSWRRIAVLQTPPRPTIVPGGVTFYATSRAAAAPAVAALERFSRHLTPGTSLTIFGDAAAAHNPDRRPL